MDNEKMLVEVVIPIYKLPLPQMEMELLQHNVKELHNYPICIVVPEGLNTDQLIEQLPEAYITVMQVSDEWLGSRNGVAGYNQMMLSSAFYQLFDKSRYILICQTDAYIFSDELTYWCNQGYDYIGAPWYRKKKYDSLFSRLYLKFKKLQRSLFGGEVLREEILGKVGNGGLSLRKVESFIRGCDSYGEAIGRYLESDHPLANEDVFWSMEPDFFRYPSYIDAMHFAVDTKPKACMKMLNGSKPFGCHGVTHPRYIGYWREVITLHGSVTCW